MCGDVMIGFKDLARVSILAATVGPSFFLHIPQLYRAPCIHIGAVHSP